MRKSGASAAAVLTFLMAAAASEAADFLKGPWLQNVTTGGVAVMWEADEQEAVAPAVDYGVTAGYESGSVSATHASVNGYHVYSAAITGLTSDTVYHYRVTSGATQTSDATFKTAPAKGSSGFRFYAIGDNRTGTSTWGALTEMIREDMSEYPAHHQTFLLNSGDLINDGRYYAYWDELVPPAQSLLARLPMYVGLGNHEDRNTSVSDAFVYGYHDFPYAASASTDEKWYSFDYGNLHLAAMAVFDNGGYTSGPQYDWIQSDLAAADGDADIDWTFALLHFLPWSLGGDHPESSAANLRTYIHPVFRDENVTCAFGGHNHIYARYEPIDGVTYITTGGGGAPIDTGSYSAWTGGTLGAYAGVYHYCAVDIEDYAVTVRAIDIDGNLVDYETFGGTALDRPPFSDAGANVSGTTGAPVALDGTGSEDPESSGLTYEWTQVGGLTVTLSGAGTAAPSFTTAIGGEYVFQLRVNDGTYWSTPDFCVATVSDGTATFNPEADTYIDDLNPSTNYGSDTVLLLDTESHEYHTYLRFNVTGVGSVLVAALKLYCFDPGDTAEIRTSADTGWAEGTPTWNSPLDESGAVVGSLTTSPVGWVQADVTDAVAGDGRVTFVLLPGGGNGADFQSRENTNTPVLEVTYTADLAGQDSDGDGLSDYDEIYWDGNAGYNPYHPVTNPSGTDTDTSTADTDGDGQSDVIEARCGGDPLDAGVTTGLIRVNFQPGGSTEPSGFCASATDAYSALRGYGWLVE